MRDIFNQTIECLGDPITIQEGPVPDALGACDERTGTITIRPDQPTVGKHVVLLHELLHLVDGSLVGNGLQPRRVSHDWIRMASPNLLFLLVAAGIWQGITVEEVIEFMAQQEGAEEE